MKKKRRAKRAKGKRAMKAMGPLAKTHYVFVYQEDANTLKVFPSVLVTDGGDEVELVNCADEDVTWEVPKGPFDASQPLKEKVDKKNGRSKKHKTRKVTLATKYTVTGTKTMRRAVGGSDPVIIIEG